MSKCSCQFLMCPAAAVEVGGIWRKEENLAAVLFKVLATIFPAESLATPLNQSPDHWLHVSMLQLPKFPSQLILCALFSISKTVPKSRTVLPLEPFYFLLLLEITPGFQNMFRCFWWGSLRRMCGVIHRPGFLTGFHMNMPIAVLQIILWAGG